MRNKKGLTLIETIINIYVYVILISVCVTISMVDIKSRTVLRQKQQAVEELSMVIIEISKEVRMSECAGVGDKCIPDGLNNQLIIQPNRGGNPITYEISSDYKLKKISGGTEDVMLENVSGYFSAVRDNLNEIPLIRIRLWKKDKNGNDLNDTRIFNSVSMRSKFETENLRDLQNRDEDNDGNPISVSDVDYKFPEKNIVVSSGETEEDYYEDWIVHETSYDDEN